MTNNAVVVTDGLFTVLIDFGAGAFTGATNWLQIGVETNGASPFTTLAPRRQLTPVPYAIYAESGGALSSGVALGEGAGNTISASGSADSFIGGGQTNTVNSSSAYSVIGGGIKNTTSAQWATVGGGGQNTASGPYSRQ